MPDLSDEKAQAESQRIAQAVSDLQGEYRAAHLLAKRGRVYDTCSCGWYGSNHPGHVAEQSSPPERS